MKVNPVEMFQIQKISDSSGRDRTIGKGSPLATDIQPSPPLTKNLDGRYSQSTEHENAFINFRTQSNSSGSQRGNAASVITMTASPLTKAKGAFGGKSKLSDLRSIHQSTDSENPQNNKAYGKKKVAMQQHAQNNIAVQVKRRSIPEEDHSFMPQPTVLTSTAGLEVGTPDLHVTGKVIAPTNLTIGSKQATTLLDRTKLSHTPAAAQDKRAQAGADNGFHGGYIHNSLANSVNFEQLRYQNISKLQTTQAVVGVIPSARKSDLSKYEYLTTTPDQARRRRPFQLLVGTTEGTIDGDQRAERETNRVGWTSGKDYETHKSVQPRTAAMRASGEFQCRYKELTLYKKPPGAVPLQVTVGPQFRGSKASRFQSRGTTDTISKRQSSMNATQRLTLGANGQLSPGSSWQNRTHTLAMSPQVQLPNIRTVKNANGRTPHTINQNHLQNSQLKKQLLYGTSQEQFTRPHDQLSSRNQKLLRDGMSQDLPPNKRGPGYVNVQSYQSTQESSGRGHQHHLSVQHQSNGTMASLFQHRNSGRQMPQQASALRGKPELASPQQEPVRPFELPIGGQTGASIFRDETHSRKEHEAYIDRLYGARHGGKLRSGQSVDATHPRTMQETLQFIHPRLRELAMRQYRHQRDNVSPTGHAPTGIWPRDEAGATSVGRSTDSFKVPSSTQIDTYKPEVVPKAVDPILVEFSTEKPVSESKHSDSEHVIAHDDPQMGTMPEITIIRGIDQENETGLQRPQMDFESITEETQPSVVSETGEQAQQEMDAFEQFKALGGSFYRQKERQIITMDNNGGLHYEQRDEQNKTTNTNALRSFKMGQQDFNMMMEEPSHEEKWELFKEDVMKVVKKGILSNKPKPKKVIPPPEPVPEIDHLLHMEVRTIPELLHSFSAEERKAFDEELARILYKNYGFRNKQVMTTPETFIHWSSKFNARDLIDEIDELQPQKEDAFKVHLCQVWKMLFKKRTEMAHSKQRLSKFDESSLRRSFDAFMKKVYDAIVAELRAEITQRRVEKSTSEGKKVDTQQANIDAENAMSLTRITEKQLLMAKREAAAKDAGITEYIKYLIGQAANKDFTLRREEFRQTHELYTRSLALHFDDYAAKEDNTMKTVANDILEKIEMNVVIQENTMPIAALKYAEDPKFSYFMKVKQQMSLALPLLAKVVNKQLSLHNYTLGREHCIAFAETCKINFDFMSKLVLNNNGLSDDDLACLLDGMVRLDAISVLDLRKNTVGSRSVRLMQDLMIRDFPHHLQVLRIVDCKINHSATFLLLSLLKEKSRLRTLALVNVAFDERNEKELVAYLDSNTTLRELDLSWNQISQRSFVKILQNLIQNSNLLALNLSHNLLIVDPKRESKAPLTEEAKLINKDKMAKITTGIRLERRQTKLIQDSIIQGLGLNKSIKTLDYESAEAGSHRESEERKGQSNQFMDIKELDSEESEGGSRLSKFNASTNNQAFSIANLSPRTTNSVQQLNPEEEKKEKRRRQNARRDAFFKQMSIEQHLEQNALRSVSSFGHKKELNEKRARRVLNAKKHVSGSSELNQVMTLLLCDVMKKNRKLQHLDLTQTNLPSHVIIHLCDRLRKSRSILSVHLTDNPGLMDSTIQDTLHSLLKCKPDQGPKVKIEINKQIDFALDSSMVQRLQRQLQSEKVQDGDQFLARDAIKLRQIMQQKRIDQKAIDFPKFPESKQMILNRIIGFKEQMPGSGQWSLLTDPKDQCWYRDQWIYSLIFWDAETIGRNAQKKVHYKILNQMQKKVEQLNPGLVRNPSSISLSVYESANEDESGEEQSLKRDQTIDSSPNKNESARGRVGNAIGTEGSEEKDTNPLLFGSFTNWKPQKMMRLEDFIMILAKKYGRQNQEMYEDFGEILSQMRKQISGLNRRASRFLSQSTINIEEKDKNMQLPNENVRSYNELTEQQQKFFEVMRKQRQRKILADWKGVIEQYLEYRKPFLVDAYQMKNHKGRCPDLYVLPVFMPAGKHSYLVKNLDTYQYSMHNVIADFRTEDPPVLIKEIKSRTVERVFRKETSVFEPWKEDTELGLQLACESDLSSSKLAKVVKDPNELTKIYDIIFEKFNELKLIFLEQACHSSYPFINQLDFRDFCEQYQLIGPTLKAAVVDVAYTAAVVQPGKGQLAGLNRSAFMEAMVRIGTHKYTDSNTKAAEAFLKFLQNDIFPYWQLTPPWQEFRSRYLWTLDVNDVLSVNRVGLEKLYNRQHTPHKTWMDMAEASYLFTNETSLVSEYAFKVCYGFSKMTIENEVNHQHQHQRLQFVEFLECIGRVAAAYWEANKEHLQEVPLAKKVEFVLDQLLPLVNVKRNEVHVSEESESCTDEDY